MEPKIVFKDQITLICEKVEVNGPEKKKFNQFKEVRETFTKRQDLVKNQLNDHFVVAYDFDFSHLDRSHDDMVYTYYYGKAVTDDTPVPEGMSKKTIAPARFAVFTYNLETKELNGKKIDQPIYDYINGVWLPHSDYKLSEKDDFEIWDNKNKLRHYYISIVDM